ncbi:MAG: RsmG family class I SAM-dependent methyltransferase [Mariprofundaceae bacterium]
MNNIEEKLATYCDEILRFRKVLNLTSIDETNTLMQRFISPSLELAAWMPSSGRLLDIGSGMGIPGIPLLLLLPNLQGVLVERRKKRAEFLRHLVRLFKLDAEVYDADVASLPYLAVDICVARAVTRADILLNLCTPHSRDKAVAVLPVPSNASPVQIPGWILTTRANIEASGRQAVQCYQYIAKEDVSRET